MKLNMIKRLIQDGTNATFQYELKPYSPNDIAQYNKLKCNVVYRCDIRQPRNLKHHSKYFALCRLLMDNSEYFTNEEQASYYLKLKTGHIEEIIVGPETIIRAKSINFETLDQTAFEDYYNSCLPIVCNILGCSEQDIAENIVFHM